MKRIGLMLLMTSIQPMEDEKELITAIFIYVKATFSSVLHVCVATSICIDVFFQVCDQFRIVAINISMLKNEK